MGQSHNIFKRSTIFLITLSGFILCVALLFPTSSSAANVYGNSQQVVYGASKKTPVATTFFPTIDVRTAYDYQEINGLMRDLKIGDTGDDVRVVQEFLNKSLPDFPAKNIDGKYSLNTYIGIVKFQIQQGLTVTGRLDFATRSSLNDLFRKKLCPASVSTNVLPVFADEIMVRVDRKNALPQSYAPNNLVPVPADIKTTNFVCLKNEIIPSLQKMIMDAESQNIHLGLTSGFRTPEMQQVIYDMLVKAGGAPARDAVALPTHSEHQLGTAIDFTSLATSTLKLKQFQKSEIEPTGFDETAEDYWLRENSYKYGFVMSYPKNKQDVTGYTYEPWHYRYVGVTVAREIFDKKITVQEYFNGRAGN